MAVNVYRVLRERPRFDLWEEVLKVESDTCVVGEVLGRIGRPIQQSLTRFWSCRLDNRGTESIYTLRTVDYIFNLRPPGLNTFEHSIDLVWTASVSSELEQLKPQYRSGRHHPTLAYHNQLSIDPIRPLTITTFLMARHVQ